MLDRFERFSFSIMCVTRYWHKIVTDEMEKHGLKGPYAIYLLALHRNREGITSIKLAELCGKDKSDASRTISEMEKAGLVYKEGNRYRALIRLTHEGKEFADRICERAAIAVEIAGRDLTDENRKIFYSALDSISANLQVLSEDGIPQEL